MTPARPSRDVRRRVTRGVASIPRCVGRYDPPVTPGLEKLSRDQQRWLLEWLPGATVERDHSWGLMERAVLELTHHGTRLIVKAGAPDDHHIGREIHAHRHWLEPWTTRGRAPQLVHFDIGANLLVTRYLPGTLVLEADADDRREIYRQAGQLLALLHGQAASTDPDYEARENRKSLESLDKPHRIARDVEETLRAEIATWPTPTTTLVPTHGDWQPRNWLVHEGEVRVIDFGRAALRPAMTDFARVDAQDFRGRPDLEAAFLDGYGADPREPEAWRRTSVREAIGTAVWAHQVGDESFEAQGHRMIAEVMSVQGRDGAGG